MDLYYSTSLLSGLFLIIDETEFASYADENTLCDARNTIKDVILPLQLSFKNVFKWFTDNEMQGNSEKCHLILTTDEPVEMQVGQSLIKRVNFEKLLHIKIDFNFTFDKHIKTICKQTVNKLRTHTT